MLRLSRCWCLTWMMGALLLQAEVWAGSPNAAQRSSTDSHPIGRVTHWVQLAESSVEDDGIVDEVARLRQLGLSALKPLLSYRKQLTAEANTVATANALVKLDWVIDQVAGQRFASQSELYWYTSREQALAAAADQDRPLLCLRMLGHLDQDFSCANSRFFRTTLYPDPTIAKLLREKFVLYWEPVREVPVVTIDFGEGRTLKRPLTGNSIHFVLNHNGEPIDAMPGLVSPQAFTDWLTEASGLWMRLNALQASESYWRQVANHHRQRAAKRRSESPYTITPEQMVADLNPADPRWREIAAELPVQLAVESRRLVERLVPAEVAMPLAVSKSVVESPLLKMVQTLERNIARDTAFNLYALQVRLDEWFAGGTTAPTWADEASWTKQVYEHVFLMPLDDPWLGLSPDTHYTALPGGGRMNSAGPPTVTPPVDKPSFASLRAMMNSISKGISD